MLGGEASEGHKMSQGVWGLRFRGLGGLGGFGVEEKNRRRSRLEEKHTLNPTGHLSSLGGPGDQTPKFQIP